MISFIRGKIKFKTQRFVVIEAGGVGYQIFCADKTLAQLGKVGDEAGLYTRLFVREDALELYGVASAEELEFFGLLLSVSGVGPKAALMILGVGPVAKIQEAIQRGDEKFFARIPGVGAKRIKQMILELSGKLIMKSEEDRLGAPQFREAQRALRGLGFSGEEVRETLKALPEDLKDSKEIVRQALRLLGRSS